MTHERAVIVFARVPVLGRVKTRLAAGCGDETALEIYRWLGRRTVDAALAVRNCRTTVYHTPAATEIILGWLGDEMPLRVQAEGDLGRRVALAIADVAASGAGRVVVVGTDCPDMSTAMIESAFASLSDADVVLGPTRDGGYYLIGVREPHPALFRGIPWSTGETLSATLAAAAAAGLRVSLLGERLDIDTAADWAAWCAESGHSVDTGMRPVRARQPVRRDAGEERA